MQGPLDMVTSVRPLAITDISTVVSIEIETNPLPWKEADFQGFLPEEASASGAQKRAWVAADPAVRGFACLVATAGEAELQSLAVAKKFWGHGMGGALLEA